MTQSIARDVHERGFCIVDDVVSSSTLESFRNVLDQRAETGAGVRDLFSSVPETRALVEAAQLGRHLDGAMGTHARIVRAILFDKSRGANWRVPWHQDLFVATRRRADVAGFTAWTTKDGVPHARAPREILERMLAVRIHVDDCGEANGPLRVLPGTHQHGVLNGDEIDRLARDISPRTCIASAGSILVMRPLLLHASSPATVADHRRVIHLEIADCELPLPLRWR